MCDINDKTNEGKEIVLGKARTYVQALLFEYAVDNYS